MPSPISWRSDVKVGAVGGKIEADLQFQRAMPPAQRRFGHLPRARRIDAAGIDPDSAAVAAEQLPQRRCCGGARRDPTPRDRFRRSPARTDPARRIAAPAPTVACVSFSKTSDGLAGGKSGYQRRQHLVDQPRPVFRAGRREIRPDLAPADMAVIILDANEHRRPIQHPAERGDDRRRQRIAIAEGLRRVRMAKVGDVISGNPRPRPRRRAAASCMVILFII